MRSRDTPRHEHEHGDFREPLTPQPFKVAAEGTDGVPVHEDEDEAVEGCVRESPREPDEA